MEEKKKSRPKIRIHVRDVCEQLYHLNFDYASFSFEDLNYYVWGCQNFALILKVKEFKDTAIQDSDYLFSNRDNENIQAKERE